MPVRVALESVLNITVASVVSKDQIDGPLGVNPILLVVPVSEGIFAISPLVIRDSFAVIIATRKLSSMNVRQNAQHIPAVHDGAYTGQSRDRFPGYVLHTSAFL